MSAVLSAHASPVRSDPERLRSVMTDNVTWHAGDIDRERRAELLGQRGAVVWLTGLSGSGKSTLAVETERHLVETGRFAFILDGDNVRHGLNADLGFGAADRAENVRRVGEVALLMAEAGLVVLVPLISPYRDGRDAVRRRAELAGVPFREVWVATPIEVCEARDPKGLYAKARAGEITGFTGIDDPYEAPEHPELVVGADGDRRAPVDLVADVLELLVPEPSGEARRSPSG